MQVSEFFLKLLVILLSAMLFAEVFSRLSIPSVLGEVVAGLVIGPSVLGFVTPDVRCTRKRSFFALAGMPCG